MSECVPIVLSLCLGFFLRVSNKRHVHAALASFGVVLIALGAYVASGEFKVSWAYFLLDLLQSSLGFLAGVALPRVLLRTKAMRKAN